VKAGKASPEALQTTAQHSFSLRLRMGLAAALILIMALGLVGLALASANKLSAEAGLRERMQSWAYLILAASEPDAEGHIQVSDDLGDPRLSQPGSGIYGLLHSRDQYWSSASTLGTQLPKLDLIPTGQISFRVPKGDLNAYVYQLGLSWQLDNEQVVPLTVSILVASEEIERLTTAFKKGLWGALGTAGLILLIAQSLLIWLAFRPLQGVARDVAAIESGGSEALAGRYPLELEPLVRNLNNLLATEKANQLRYRNALDSLAHSLKTPLAVIRSGLENPDLESAGAMRRATDDMSHLVSTRLQRAAGSTRRTMTQAVDVGAAVERLLRSLEKVYSQKMIKAAVSIPAGVVFHGEERDLLEILGNLLDNAFKYGRRQVSISARAMTSTGRKPGLQVKVEDDGPGIAAEQWPLVLQRGVRGDERVEGHGLGLAIVLELLSAYGGNMEIGPSELGGAAVELTIPPA
jgi:two-component system sensor histidine kinase PhoQ